jgi:hypothetical protein
MISGWLGDVCELGEIDQQSADQFPTVCASVARLAAFLGRLWTLKEAVGLRTSSWRKSAIHACSIVLDMTRTSEACVTILPIRLMSVFVQNTVIETRELWLNS